MRKIITKLKVYRLVAWTLAILMLLGYIPQGIHLKKMNLFKNIDKVQAATTLQNPRIVEASFMDAGQKVTWDCVYLGSYPQSEVTAADGSIYDTLKNATGWDSNNDIVVDGTKYRRLKGEDATYATIDDSGETFYNWNNNYKTYHYFKYEPIKWRVLRKNGNDVFLLANVALDNQKYNTDYTDITWETSSVRSWLNGYNASVNQPRTDYSSKNFINIAFTSAQRNAISTTNVVNANNLSNGTIGGNNTSDKVFLLSESEVYNTDTAAKYGFVKDDNIDDEARISQCSTYAHAMGIGRYYNIIEENDTKYNGNIWWWLRSPGESGNCATGVYDHGGVGRYGNEVDSSMNGVRPALHLNLSSYNPTYAGTVCSEDMAKKTYIESCHVGQYSVMTDTSGNMYAMIDGEKYPYSDEFDSGDIGTRLPELDNQNVVYELHDEKISNVYTMNEVLDVKLDVKFSTEDGITYRKGKFNPKSTEIIVRPTVVFNNKFLEKGIWKLLNDTERERLYLTLKTLKVFPEKGGQVDFGSSGWGLNKEEKDEIEVLMNDRINLNETKEYKYPVNFHKSAVPDELSYDVSLSSNVIFEGNVQDSELGTITIGNMDYQEGRSAANKSNSDLGKDTAKAADVLKNIRTAMQFKQNLFSGDQMNQMTDFVNTWMTDLILARCVNRSSLKDQIQDKVTDAWLTKLGYNLSDVSSVVLKPTMISAVNYISLEAKNGKPVIIEFQINMYGFKFGKNSEMPTMATGSGTATVYDMNGNKLDTATILPAYADVCAFTEQLQQVARDTIMDGSKNALKIFGVSAEATAEALSTELISKVVNTKYGKNVFKKVNASTVQKALGQVIEKGEKYTNKKILKLVTKPSKDSTWLEVKCPVDVKVYDRSGNLCGVIKNNKVDSANTDIYMNVVDDKKNIYLIGDDYSLELTGTDQGTMDYVITEFDEDGNRTRQITYEKVKLSNGCKYYAYVPEAGNSDSVLFNLVNEHNNILRPTRGEDKVIDLSVKPAKDNKPSVKQKVKKIKLKGLSSKIAAGKKLKLTAVITPSTASNKKLKWKSSNTKVATVTQRGIVTLKKNSGGKKVTITAMALDGSKKKASWKIMSMKGIVKKVKITGKTTVKAGKSVKLKASVKATSKANKKLLWTSSNTKYATVNSQGVVKAKKSGKGKKVKITAMATDGSGKKATIAIKIK